MKRCGTTVTMGIREGQPFRKETWVVVFAIVMFWSSAAHSERDHPVSLGLFFFFFFSRVPPCPSAPSPLLSSNP